MIYNLILDDKFKEIDEEANKDLDNLQNNKDLFFGEEKQATFLLGIDIIYAKFGVGGKYEKQYREQLLSVMAETVDCLDGQKTSINTVKSYFTDNALVNNLIRDKNSRRQKVAIDILTLNKQQIRKDSSKKFMQVRRTMYDSVSNLFMINLGYLMRIMFKWASKTKNPY
ncbi:MAG: hypothetical protein Q9M97_08885 [Candidatus Gracilibacteria bacterium]|nr:hypothetical protein [Candidatus Gracilibacteria bacterium]